MSRKVVRLTLDNLAAVEAPCRNCLFWELEPVARSRVPADEVLAEKQAWLSTVLREWGSAGRVLLDDGQPAGLISYAPAVFVPGAATFPTSPVSADAVVLTTVYVDPAHRGYGLGRVLIQTAARDLIKRGGVRAIEAFGGTGGCRVPVDFLGSVGFKTQRPHPVTPRMRMDLKGALTWRDELEAALERLAGVVRPAPEADPASPRVSRGSPGAP